MRTSQEKTEQQVRCQPRAIDPRHGVLMDTLRLRDCPHTTVLGSNHLLDILRLSAKGPGVPKSELILGPGIRDPEGKIQGPQHG